MTESDASHSAAEKKPSVRSEYVNPGLIAENAGHGRIPQRWKVQDRTITDEVYKDLSHFVYVACRPM